MAKEIKDYIREVDLVVFMAKEYGFRLDEEKMGKHKDAISSRSVTMINEEGDRVVVGRDMDGLFYYKEVHENQRFIQDEKLAQRLKTQVLSDKGDVFKFIQFRHNSTMYQAARLLDRYIKNNPESELKKFKESIGYSQVQKSERTESPLAVENELRRNVKGEKIDTSYLESRGLSKDIILNPKFANRTYTGNYHDKARGENVKNTIFPLFNERFENIGLERRNNSEYHDKKIRGHKSEGLWISEFNTKRPVDNIYISESPIDAMSYHEMYAKPMENNIYMATMGSMSSVQLDLINKATEKVKPAHFGSITDNDVQGYRYDLKLLGSVGPNSHLTDKSYAESNPEFANAQFSMNSAKGKEFAEFGIRVNANNKVHAIEITGKLLSKVEELNLTVKLMPGEKKPFKMAPSTLNDNSVMAVVKFLNNKANWGKIVDFAHSLKHGASKMMSFQKSFFSDFNRDLQVSKGMGKLLDNVEKNTLFINNAPKFKIPQDFYKKSFAPAKDQEQKQGQDTANTMKVGQ